MFQPSFEIVGFPHTSNNVIWFLTKKPKIEYLKNKPIKISPHTMQIIVIAVTIISFPIRLITQNNHTPINPFELNMRLIAINNFILNYMGIVSKQRG